MGLGVVGLRSWAGSLGPGVLGSGVDDERSRRALEGAGGRWRMLGSGQPRTPVNAHGPRRTVCHGPSEEGLRRSFFLL